MKMQWWHFTPAGREFLRQEREREMEFLVGDPDAPSFSIGRFVDAVIEANPDLKFPISWWDRVRNADRRWNRGVWRQLHP